MATVLKLSEEQRKIMILTWSVYQSGRYSSKMEL